MTFWTIRHISEPLSGSGNILLIMGFVKHTILHTNGCYNLNPPLHSFLLVPSSSLLSQPCKPHLSKSCSCICYLLTSCMQTFNHLLHCLSILSPLLPNTPLHLLAFLSHSPPTPLPPPPGHSLCCPSLECAAQSCQSVPH